MFVISSYFASPAVPAVVPLLSLQGRKMLLVARARPLYDDQTIQLSKKTVSSEDENDNTNFASKSREIVSGDIVSFAAFHHVSHLASFH